MQKVWLIQEVKTKKYFDCNCSLSVDLTFQGKSWWQWKTTHHQEIENRHSDLFAVGTSCLVSSVKTKRASQDIKQLSHETMFENRVSIFFKICTRLRHWGIWYMWRMPSFRASRYTICLLLSFTNIASWFAILFFSDLSMLLLTCFRVKMLNIRFPFPSF